MSEERRIMVEEVGAVSPPPRARVEDAAESQVEEGAREKLERKRDYLEGFLAAQP